MAGALLVIGFILRRQMSGGSEMGAIGAARRSRTTFADVGGHEGTVAELRELVEFLKAPEAFQAVVWHLLVSHPALKVAQTKWESTK